MGAGGGLSPPHFNHCTHAAIPDVETRPEPEIDNPAEVKVSMSAICEVLDSTGL